MNGLFFQRCWSITPQTSHTATGNKTANPIHKGGNTASVLKILLQLPLLCGRSDFYIANKFTDISMASRQYDGSSNLAQR
jgi:hypothetical protein